MYDRDLFSANHEASMAKIDVSFEGIDLGWFNGYGKTPFSITRNTQSFETFLNSRKIEWCPLANICFKTPFQGRSQGFDPHFS